MRIGQNLELIKHRFYGQGLCLFCFLLCSHPPRAYNCAGHTAGAQYIFMNENMNEKVNSESNPRFVNWSWFEIERFVPYTEFEDTLNLEIIQGLNYLGSRDLEIDSAWR